MRYSAVVNGIGLSRRLQAAGMTREVGHAVAEEICEAMIDPDYRARLDPAEMSRKFQAAGMEQSLADPLSKGLMSYFSTLNAEYAAAEAARVKAKAEAKKQAARGRR